MNTGTKIDIQVVESILPSHYTVKESVRAGSIHCKSPIGIRQPPFVRPDGRVISDAEDEDCWQDIMQALKYYFDTRFLEVFHNTCFCHVDFTIYLNTQP